MEESVDREESMLVKSSKVDSLVDSKVQITNYKNSENDSKVQITYYKNSENAGFNPYEDTE
jgi:hypothetical protein